MYTVFDVTVPMKYNNDLEALKAFLDKICHRIYEIDSSIPRNYNFSVINLKSSHNIDAFPTIVAQYHGDPIDDNWDVLKSIMVVSTWLQINDV